MSAEELIRQPIYLDYHASTPTDPRVLDVVASTARTIYGNANDGGHSVGEAARAEMARAARTVALLLGTAPSRVQFVPSASFALHLALGHAIESCPREPLRVAMMPVEHGALLRAVEHGVSRGLVDVEWLDVDRFGQLKFGTLLAALDQGVDLVCLMGANNEIGTVYPLAQVAALCQHNDTGVLVDASQSAAYVRYDCEALGLDYLIVSGHKICGVKGAAAAVIPQTNARHREAWLLPIGTPNIPAIVGLARALELAGEEREAEIQRTTELRDRLQNRLESEIVGVVVNGDPAFRLPNNLHFSVPGLVADAVVSRLSKTVALSTGAACNSGADSESHVLRALRMPGTFMDGSLRIGIGRFTTMEEIDTAGSLIIRAVSDVRRETGAGQDG